MRGKVSETNEKALRSQSLASIFIQNLFKYIPYGVAERAIFAVTDLNRIRELTPAQSFTIHKSRDLGLNLLSGVGDNSISCSTNDPSVNF